MSAAENFDFQNTPAGERRGTWPYARAASGDSRIMVSIVTPFFNPGAVFSETVLTVRRQSLQSWEWIVVDDGSTDAASAAALAGAAAHEPRIRIIRLPENRGLSAARNRGLAEAAADYVCWLDADDLIEHTFLEKCLWRLQALPRVAFTKGFSIGFGAANYLWRHGFHEGERFLKENRTDPTSVMQTAAARAIGGFDETIRAGLEDWDFWLRAANGGYWGDTITEPLSWYRRREEHLNRWANLQVDSKREGLEAQFRTRYPRLWSGGFPKIEGGEPPATEFAASTALANPLEKRRPRALLIVPHLELGGADSVNLDLLAQLTQRFDWETTVVTTRHSEDPWRQKFYDLTSDVFMLHRFLPFSAYPAFLSYLIESRQPDVVCLNHSELGYRLLPWLKEAFPTLPIIDLVHIVMDDWKDGGFPRLSCQSRPWLTRTVATSQALRRWLIVNGANGEAVDSLYTGIDAAHWTRSAELTETARERWKIPADRPAILYAARFAAQKQPRLLPEIVRELEARGRRFILLLVGDGPERTWLEEHLCKRHARSVRMLGPIDLDEMRLVMSASDLLLLPSREEGIALVLFEAMSMGAVPVATDVGGQRELVTPDCGVLLPFDERLGAAMVEALDALLKDESLRRRLAGAGRKRIEDHFRLDQTGEQLNAIFRGVMREQAAPLKARASPVDIGEIAGELAELQADNLAPETWEKQLREGRWLPVLASRIAELLRKSPLRLWFRRFEIRYGTRMGRWITRRH
jgi:glycosyltransferase involved in cell wall biosynthesis